MTTRVRIIAVPSTGTPDPYVHVQHQPLPVGEGKYLEIIIGGGFKNTSAHELGAVAELLGEALLRVQQSVELLLRRKPLGTEEEKDG